MPPDPPALPPLPPAPTILPPVPKPTPPWPRATLPPVPFIVPPCPLPPLPRLPPPAAGAPPRARLPPLPRPPPAPPFSPGEVLDEQPMPPISTQQAPMAQIALVLVVRIRFSLSIPSTDTSTSGPTIGSRAACHTVRVGRATTHHRSRPTAIARLDRFAIASPLHCRHAHWPVTNGWLLHQTTLSLGFGSLTRGQR